MKISYSWLKDYIHVDLKPEKAAQLLTDCGLEVEGVEEIQSVKGGLEGLVIGEVLTKEKHPDADRLNLTTVNVGNGEPLHIVCGAPNVDVGQKVVVATVGTTLYSGDDSFKIKKSKIRGALSEGMICAEDEIGLGTSHDGIMILDADAQVGTPAKDYFKIENDAVFEIGLTPNRADATGHIGVARDLAAVLSMDNPTSICQPSVSDFKVDNTGLSISVEVEDPALCPRYSAVTISNIRVGESPDWLKNRLKSIGLNPINNVVDVTNYVLHETGHPLHAFDAAKIKGNKVVVRTAKNGTKFTTLDEVERELDGQDLMICDAEKEMCIAGVFGGQDSGVSDSTTSIFLESAYFNPVSIRKSAKRHGLNTDASFRFERGADPNNTIYALKRAALLIREVAGGEISSEIVDVYPNPITDFQVELTYANCDRLIGKQLDRGLIKQILQALGITIVKESDAGLQLAVPPFKVDVQREVDVIEEILRVYGYNQVELPSRLTSSLSYRQKPDKEKVVNLIADLLVANGYNEMLSNSLTKASYYNNNDNLVKIQNPLSNDLAVMRQSMLFNGLETIVYNQNRKSDNLKLFEFGSTYLVKEDRFSEQNTLSMFATGSLQPENWNAGSAAVDYYYLKGVVEAIMEKFGFNKFNVAANEWEDAQVQYGLSMAVNNLHVVNYGKVSPELQQQFDIDKEVFYAEWNVDHLLRLVAQHKTVYKEIPKFPTVRRDLALLLDADVTYQSVKDLASKQERALLKNVNLFDVYQGKNLPAGKKSYGVSFSFQDSQKTLTDKQIDQVMQKIITALEKELGAQLR
ncbi:MAG: phenylalanine--tRNA ligase subunit beta [Flavobacteriales bacterium]|nr:phenylalanine--tRNA ligase subunit beta [Flavobacteriales bacterium]